MVAFGTPWCQIGGFLKQYLGLEFLDEKIRG
jgi:hypothetical protein